MSASPVRPAPPDIHAPPSKPRSLTRGPPIIDFESSVCCVIYCCPTSYRGRLLLGKINHEAAPLSVAKISIRVGNPDKITDVEPR